MPPYHRPNSLLLIPTSISGLCRPGSGVSGSRRFARQSSPGRKHPTHCDSLQPAHRTAHYDAFADRLPGPAFPGTECGDSAAQVSITGNVIHGMSVQAMQINSTGAFQGVSNVSAYAMVSLGL